MIFILHGNNYSKTRDNLTKVQNKLSKTEKKELLLDEITPEKLKEACSEFDLFSEPPFVILDVSGAGRKNVKAFVEAIKEISNEATLVILSNKELTKKNAFLKLSEEDKTVKVVATKTEESSSIFGFTDMVFSKRKKESYEELKKLVAEGADPFYMFSMLLYSLRNIAQYKFDSPSFEKLAPFVKNKTRAQSKNFTENEIKEIYDYFYVLDKEVKTGVYNPELLIPRAIEKVLS